MNRYPHQNLTLILWNANGLLRHVNELEYLLHQKRIDIALITETHFTSRTRIYIKDYTVHHVDRPDDRGYGGSAVIIRSSIQHHIHPAYGATDSTQMTAVSLRLGNTSVSVAALYCPPRFVLTNQDFTNIFSSLGGHFKRQAPRQAYTMGLAPKQPTRPVSPAVHSGQQLEHPFNRIANVLAHSDH